MKTIIAGSRTIDAYTAVALAVERSGWAIEITEVVSGGARGVDQLGERWAQEHSIPVRRFPTDWASRGKAAGPIRNEEMAVYADALIVVWDGTSPGTADMIRRAEAHGLRVSIERVNTVPGSIDDLYPDAASLRNHRAWLRTARTAPIPLRRVAYAPLRLDAHAAAITAALAADQTSLQTWKEQSMARTQLLIGPTTPPLNPASASVSCLVCRLVLPRALTGHAICTHCVEQTANATRILAAREQQAIDRLTAATAGYDRAYAALDATERGRWDAIARARLVVGRGGRWTGTADVDMARRLQATKRAIDNGSPLISQALRNAWVADEALFWANEIASGDLRQVEVARDALETALEVVQTDEQRRQGAA